MNLTRSSLFLLGLVAVVCLSVYIFRVKPSSGSTLEETPKPHVSPTGQDTRKQKVDEVVAHFWRAMRKEARPGEETSPYRILRQLNEMGEHVLAWNLIDKEPGEKRRLLLHTWFETADLPLEEMLTYAKQLQTPEERSDALMFTLVGANSLEEFASMATDEKTNAYIKDSVAAGINISEDWLGDAFYMACRRIESPSQRRAYCDLMVKYFNEGTIPLGPFLNTLLDIDDRPAAEQWKIVGGLSGKNDRGCLEELKGKIVKSLIGEDPVSTMTMLRQGAPEVSSLNVYLGLKAWAAEDPAAANAWYEQNKQNFNPLEQLTTIKAFCVRALEVGEFDGAKAWAEQFPEPSLRETFLKQVEALEAKANAKK